MIFNLKRTYNEKTTTGFLTLESKFSIRTLELPYLSNMRNVSCIPEGVYHVIKQSATQERPYNFFRFWSVPNRSGILIHKITYVKDLKGCIGVGLILLENPENKSVKMLESTTALNKLWLEAEEQFAIKIFS